MPESTIAARRQRRCILMTTDRDTLDAFHAATPENWECVVVSAPEGFREWNQVLLHRVPGTGSE